MKFSILIAHYNNFKYFQDCYKSIINQTIQDFEVIIVDDCSTDNSLNQIEELIKNDIRFKIYKNKENKGVGYTKKKCIELASSDICGFLDPDDALVENTIEIILNSYKNQKKAIAVYSQCFFCDEALNIKNVVPSNSAIKNSNPLFFNIFFEVNHFFTFKKEYYIQTTGIDETLKIAEDQDLYLKLYEKGYFKFIKIPLYLYRRHSNGLSQDNTQGKIERKKTDWAKVLFETLKRRGITILYGKNIDEIDDLPSYIYRKQNTFLKRFLRKLK